MEAAADVDNPGQMSLTPLQMGKKGVPDLSASRTREGTLDMPHEPNWWEFRHQDKQPERRSYHSTFVFDNKLFVYGGKDLQIGYMDNLWCIDLRDLQEFVPGQGEYQANPQWEQIKINGTTKPPALSNHSSVVYKNKMYLFGGSSNESENTSMYTLDLQLFKWSLVNVKPEGDESNLPKTRDEHSCVLVDNHMIVFGGFTFGQRTNDIFQFDLKKNTWKKIQHVSKEAPLPRAGHSAVIKEDEITGHCMYIFGGKDDDNNKLNDTWKFNFTSNCWTQIVGTEEPPIPRSGHTAQVYKDNYMIIYGGIFFVTRELNDMHVFDMKKERWLCLFEQLNSPAKSSMQPPGSGLRKAATKIGHDSPRKMEGTKATGFGASRNQATRKSMANTSKGKRKPKPKIQTGVTGQVDDRVIDLESPTSVTMKNSYLIKNADPSFEKSYQLIKKRALQREASGQPLNDYDESQTKTPGKRPPARDGHTGSVLGDCFFVFGGDRHCMPFNDFHMLDIKSEFASKHFLF